MPPTQREAKQFFAERIITQAESDGVGLSDAEQAMLCWSESDPEFRDGHDLAERLAAEVSDEDYEAKIASLAERALDHDLEAGKSALVEWRTAFNVLRKGDHYILVMIDRAVGLTFPPHGSWFTADNLSQGNFKLPTSNLSMRSLRRAAARFCARS